MFSTCVDVSRGVKVTGSIAARPVDDVGVWAGSKDASRSVRKESVSRWSRDLVLTTDTVYYVLPYILLVKKGHFIHVQHSFSHKSNDESEYIHNIIVIITHVSSHQSGYDEEC